MATEEVGDVVSLLSGEERDFLVRNNGDKVPVKDLVGKNILLYFSAHWCGPCRAFLPKVIEEYHKIKNKDSTFEVVFISSDRDQAAFEDFFSGMPWLALPFGDERKKTLDHVFEIRGIPSLVAIGPSGNTVTKDARYLLSVFGADAYPFTEDKIKELEARAEEMAKEWPEKIKLDELHEHELVLTRCRTYGCDECGQMGSSWSFHCVQCDFDLHPKCALEQKEKEKATSGGEQVAATADSRSRCYVYRFESLPDEV